MKPAAPFLQCKSNVIATTSTRWLISLDSDHRESLRILREIYVDVTNAPRESL